MPLPLILAFDVLFIVLGLTILGLTAIAVGALSFHELPFAIIMLLVGACFVGVGILLITKDLS